MGVGASDPRRIGGEILWVSGNVVLKADARVKNLKTVLMHQLGFAHVNSATDLMAREDQGLPAGAKATWRRCTSWAAAWAACRPRRWAAEMGSGARATMRRVVVAGLLVALLGGAGFVGASRLGPRPLRVVGGDLPINASGARQAAVEAYNSPSVVVSPRDARQVVVASRQDEPQLGCGLHVSRDGGSTWERRPLDAGQGGAVGCFAPDAAFGADGTLFVAFTSLGRVEGRGTVPDGLWIVRSTDGGATLSTPTKVRGPSPFSARLGTDPDHPERLYLTWLDGSATSSWGFINPGSPIVAARSDDRGATWSASVTVSPPSRQRVVAPSVVVAGGGGVFLSYLDVGDDRLDYDGAHEGRGGPAYPGPWSLVVTRSFDLGASWREATVDAGLVPVQRFLVLFPPTPSLVVDPSNRRRLYVAFHDASSGDADVRLWASDDGARTWGRPSRVFDGPARDGRSQYLPAVAVARTGRVDVVYFDRRGDAADVMNEVSLQSSYDGGRTFTPHVRLASRPFDSRVGFGSDRGMAEMGSRLGIVSTNDGLLAVWADTRAGTTTTNRQDLARALVASPGRPPARQPARIGALLVAALGLLVAALGGRRPRRTERPGDPSCAL